MIIDQIHTNRFRVGRTIALAEVRDYQEAGLWTKELRTRLIRSAIVQKRYMQCKYPDMHGVITYYAGRIAALKSQMTAQFSERREGQDKEIAHLFSLSSCMTQEHLREQAVYMAASGWDWEQDEEDELGLIEHLMTFSLSPSDIQFAFDFSVRWLCISLVFSLFLSSAVPVYMIPCVLLYCASLAYSLEERK